MSNNWDHTVEDVQSYFKERRREYDTTKMLKLIDELAQKGDASRSTLHNPYGTEDFISTTLGHVTMAIQGKGSVKKDNGWYSTTSEPHTYHLNPDFSQAWKN
jgi:hypothetical protein